MASSRFYRPKIASPTRSEKKFIDAAGNNSMNYFIPDEDDEDDVLMTRGVGVKTDQYQITYNFSSNIRQNIFLTINGKTRKYGVGGISFRLLYEFLCEHFNGGEYFIDTYFNQTFETRSVHAELDTLNDSVAEAVDAAKEELLSRVPMKKDGTPNMRFNISKLFMNFAFWQKPIVRSECARVAEAIRKDIVRCLSTSQLPLRKQAVSKKTALERAKMPSLDAHQFFYASGSLINSLSIYVELKR